MSVPVFVSIGFTVLIALILIFQNALTDHRGAVERRIDETIVAPSVAARSGRAPVIPQREQRERFPVLEQWLRGRGLIERFERRLVAAGLLLKPTEFVALLVISVTGMALIGFFFARSVYVIVPMVLAGYALPNTVLNSMVSRRKVVLETQLSDALIVIASGLKAGYGLLQGMQMAEDQLPDPISYELRRVLNQVHLGMPMDVALDALALRVQSYDFDLTVTTMGVALQTGGSLSGLLEQIAKTIRERIAIRGEIRAATTEARLGGIILMLLPVLMAGALMIINPLYVRLLFGTAVGQTLVKIAVAMQVLGALAMRRMLNLRV